MVLQLALAQNSGKILSIMCAKALSTTPAEKSVYFLFYLVDDLMA